MRHGPNRKPGVRSQPASGLSEAQAAYKAGDHAAAAAICQTMLDSGQLEPEALNLLAIIEVGAGKHAAGVALLDQSLAALPGQAAALCNRGFALAKLDRQDEALASYDQAIREKPDYLKAHAQRAKLLVAMNRPEEALAGYETILHRQPEHAESQAAYGNLLVRLDRKHDALASYERAIELNPGIAEAHNNRGKVLRDLGDYPAALASYDRAIALRPDYATAQTNKSLILLLTGEYAAGWQLFEWRWKGAKKDRLRKFSKPLWLGGGRIAGKRLLVWSEQGYGDMIQFCRFVPQLVALGWQVMLEVPKTLLPLISTLAADCEFVEKGNKPAGGFDFHCPLMSLPLALGMTEANLPVAPAYLAAPDERVGFWRQRLGEHQQLRVGLAWSGSPTHGNDQNRSMALTTLAPLFSLPVEFHVIQKGVRDEDARQLESSPLHSHEAAIGDFADTAALIDALDLVISVDTSLAHLAGALGKEVWVMLPFVPDYRWLLARDDSPWYPSARLFRQASIGDWTPVIEQIRTELLKRLS